VHQLTPGYQIGLFQDWRYESLRIRRQIVQDEDQRGPDSWHLRLLAETFSEFHTFSIEIHELNMEIDGFCKTNLLAFQREIILSTLRGFEERLSRFFSRACELCISRSFLHLQNFSPINTREWHRDSKYYLKSIFEHFNYGSRQGAWLQVACLSPLRCAYHRLHSHYRFFFSFGASKLEMALSILYTSLLHLLAKLELSVPSDHYFLPALFPVLNGTFHDERPLVL
jgi:hypothetical protein